VAEAARKTGALVIGIPLMPFSVEGERRALNAKEGVAELRRVVDALVPLDFDRMWKESYGPDDTDSPWRRLDIMVTDQLTMLQSDILFAWKDAGGRPDLSSLFAPRFLV
jgi:hypothetical protein